jgi:hypothetical protein
MRNFLVVGGFLVIAVLAFVFYREIETRAMVSQALEQLDRANIEIDKLRAAQRVTTAQIENRMLPARKTRVNVYFHPSGLTEADAAKIAATLKPHGFEVHIARHPAAKRPDAVYVGAFISAEEAQLVLSQVPYDIEYVFRADFPRQHGGDPEGRTIGLGYLSSHPGGADPRTKAGKLSRQQLSSLMQPKVSNTEFHQRLRKITGS